MKILRPHLSKKSMRLWGWRAPDGHCRNCGYDLRASSDRCPECGQPIGEAIDPSASPRRSQRVRFATAVLLWHRQA